MKYIKEIRELLKDPKKKALVQLGLYVIFFAVVAILFRIADNKPLEKQEEPKTAIEFYEEMKGYNYKITYTNIDKIDVIEGIYYDDKSLFTHNNFKYYYEDSLYIIDNDSYYLSSINYNVAKLFSKNLINILDDLEEESKTTYKDGTIVTMYTTNSDNVYNYLFETESNYDNLVTVNITESENKIHNIVFDLTNLGLNLTKIEVDYSHLDEIENLDFNKDNYVYKESL